MVFFKIYFKLKIKYKNISVFLNYLLVIIITIKYTIREFRLNSKNLKEIKTRSY